MDRIAVLQETWDRSVEQAVEQPVEQAIEQAVSTTKVDMLVDIVTRYTDEAFGQETRQFLLSPASDYVPDLGTLLDAIEACDDDALEACQDRIRYLLGMPGQGKPNV